MPKVKATDKPKSKYIAAVRWKYTLGYSDIDSIRLVTQEEWERLQRLLPRKQVSLGEIEGKHSDVYVDIELQDFKVTSVSPERLEIIYDVFGEQVGFDIVTILFELFPE